MLVMFIFILLWSEKATLYDFIYLYANILILQVCYYFVCMIAVCEHGHECGKAYVWKSDYKTVGWVLSTINRFWGSNSDCLWNKSMATENILLRQSKYPILEHGLRARLVGLVVHFVQVVGSESPYFLWYHWSLFLVRFNINNIPHGSFMMSEITYLKIYMPAMLLRNVAC